MENIELSIVIPVYNSEKCLDALNEQIGQALSGFTYELILVNDKSKDGSWTKIVELSKVNSHVRGLSLKKNSGQDNAIMAGLTHAKGNYVVIMDDDLQHSPFDIVRLYEKCREGFDICYGVYAEKKQSLWKNLGSRLNEILAEVLLKKPRGLYLSPFKIIRLELVQEIIRYRGPFPYLDGIVLSLTSNIAEIPIEHHKRFDGKGNYNLVKSVSVFLKHATGFSIYPLRIATIIGVFASSLSFLLGLYFVVDYLSTERHVEGWITLVLLVVFFNGLILMCVGLIGEYIGRIYLTITAKRQFVIDKETKQLEYSDFDYQDQRQTAAQKP